MAFLGDEEVLLLRLAPGALEDGVVTVVVTVVVIDGY